MVLPISAIEVASGYGHDRSDSKHNNEQSLSKRS